MNIRYANVPFDGRNGKMSGTVKVMPLRAIGSLALVLMLSACGSMRDGTTTGSVDDYRERHPIVVTEAEHSMDVPVASTDRSLNLSAREVVRGFASQRASRGQGTIQVLYPYGSPNEPAVQAVRAQIRTELKRGGINPRDIVESSYQAGGSESAPVRLSFVATTAMVASTCGEWPKNIAPSMSNRQYHNFGCAYQNNLAAQIANPSDLIGPRAMTPPDAESRANALERYRTEFTTLKEMNN